MVLALGGLRRILRELRINRGFRWYMPIEFKDFDWYMPIEFRDFDWYMPIEFRDFDY